MKKISIHRQGKLTNQASFETEEKAMEWLNSCLAKNKFGLPERPELDENGKPTGVTLPTEFEVVIEDVVPDKKELLKAELHTLQDEFFEALAEKEEGNPQPMKDYVKKRKDIKKKHE